MSVPRQSSPIEINSFVGGLVTEVSPLTFPANASLDENNFILNQDGSRNRRLGMDFEEGYSLINTETYRGADNKSAFSFYKWENAGGDYTKTLLVVQLGYQIKVFDPSYLGITSLSSNLLYTHNFATTLANQNFSYATIDGVLYIATGEKQVYTLTFSSGAFSLGSFRLKIRDTFGVKDVFASVDYRSGNNISKRPTTLTAQHLYNLRNQSWALPRKVWGPETIEDPIEEFFDYSSVSYPSNADSVPYALMPDNDDSDDRITERFNAKFIYTNPIGTTPAPMGYFIIDALDRGISRNQSLTTLATDHPELVYSQPTLQEDITPGGASVIAEYAGRVFYSGFSGEVLNGDEYSPKMSSYVLFSKLINKIADASQCYQDGDPTSSQEPDLLDTDGGLLRIEGAYGIVKLVSLGRALFVVAANGIWTIQGGSDYGFNANNYFVSKVTEAGCRSVGSIVVVDDSFMYWSNDGIYHVSQNQVGDWVSSNISDKTIKTYYNNISQEEASAANGSYDSYEKKVKWVYSNSLNLTSEVKELNFDLALAAFYPSTIANNASGIPKVIGAIEVPPFRINEINEEVISNGELVSANTEQVVVRTEVQQNGLKELYYVAITDYSPLTYTFSYYRDETFFDWVSYDAVGYDAPAYLLTGYLSAGDYQRYKSVDHITFHFRRTEDGFYADGNGDLFPLHPSSCKVQARWEWTNSIIGGRWSPEFQAYRYNRLYMPSGEADLFDDGHSVISTKNKLRGKGRVLSLYLKTEPGKDCNILGWSMVVSINGNI